MRTVGGDISRVAGDVLDNRDASASGTIKIYYTYSDVDTFFCLGCF